LKEGEKMKKIIGILFVLMLLIPVSALAAGSSPAVGSLATNKNYVVIQNTAGDFTLWTWTNSATPKVYVSGKDFKSTQNLEMTYYLSNGSSWGTANPTAPGTYFSNTVASVVDSTVDIYSSSSFTDVFFSHPVPFQLGVALAGMAQGINSQAGLIVSSAALVILILMLGISLAPRLVRWWAR
jgi:hypothetical protein